VIVNGQNISVSDAIKATKVEESFLKRRENGILLSDYQISVLNRNNINYKNYSNLSSLLFEIEECLNEQEEEELEEVSRQLSEFHYYNETNK